MPGAHATIVPLLLLQKTELPFSTQFGVLFKERRHAVFTERDIDAHLEWCSRRFANQNVLLEQDILMYGGNEDGIAPRSDYHLAMLEKTGIDAQAAQAVDKLLTKDENLQIGVSDGDDEEYTQDPLVWVRTDPKGNSPPRLEIICLSQLNSKKHKLGTHKGAKKPDSPQRSVVRDKEAGEEGNTTSPSLASSKKKDLARKGGEITAVVARQPTKDESFEFRDVAVPEEGTRGQAEFVTPRRSQRNRTKT